MSVRLRELAKFVRSKNAGAFVLTIDIMFGDEASYLRLIKSKVLTADLVASLYGLDPATVTVYAVPEALAVKITFPRRISSGDLGETDVAGGQQFAPLVNLEIA